MQKEIFLLISDPENYGHSLFLYKKMCKNTFVGITPHNESPKAPTTPTKAIYPCEPYICAFLYINNNM